MAQEITSVDNLTNYIPYIVVIFQSEKNPTLSFLIDKCPQSPGPVE